MPDDALFVRILDAAVDALNEDRPAGVPEVTTRRILPDEPLVAPRVAVFLGDENLDPPRGSSNLDPLARRRLAIAVQIGVATDDVAELDRLPAPLMAWATHVLGATKLGGLVHYIRETATQRRPEYQDLAKLVVTQIYECSYQTRRTDLTKQF